MVPKGSGNEKNIQSMLIRLKTAKNAEKCHFYGTFKPVLWILMQFSVLDMKWVSRGDINIWTSKYEGKHDKLPWIDLSSPKNE